MLKPAVLFQERGLENVLQAKPLRQTVAEKLSILETVACSAFNDALGFIPW